MRKKFVITYQTQQQQQISIPFFISSVCEEMSIHFPKKKSEWSTGLWKNSIHYLWVGNANQNDIEIILHARKNGTYINNQFYGVVA